MPTPPRTVRDKLLAHLNALVARFNAAKRGRHTSAEERELDRALDEADRQALAEAEPVKRGHDRWLSSAGQVGAGQGDQDPTHRHLPLSDPDRDEQPSDGKGPR